MKKDVFRVFTTNLIRMLVTFITAFVIPMVLSVEQYGYLKLYQFYVTYLGISHLGFCDGIYLEYGGVSVNSVDAKKVSSERNTLLLYELLVAVCFVVVGIVRQDYIIFFLGLTVIPVVLFTFITYVYQAIGEIKKYTYIMNITSTVNLLVNLGLVIIPVVDYKIYVISYCIVQWFSFLLGMYSFKKNMWIGVSGFSINIFLKYIRMGILLMLGNFVYCIFLGIDKWFIKFTMEISDFSLYSFSAQMLTIVNMFVSPISMTLYSNISRRKDYDFEIKVRRILVVILMFVPVAIYSLEFIVTNFIARYVKTIEIISILMISQIFLVLNTAVFVNLYKAYHKQKDYFIRLCISLLVAIVLDVIVALNKPNIMGYAYATMICCFFWLVMNFQYFSYMVPKAKEILFVLVLLSIYVLIGDLNLWIRLLIYMPCYIIFVRVCMKDIWMYFIGQIEILFGYVKNKF